MSALVFLGIAVVVSVIGSLLVMARHRPPRSVDHSIEDFTRTMQALSPDDRARRDRG